ncbi:MAG: hypothetical protein BroJett020_22300 [Bacteroidota bacterium]|nr:MAG: hypothetical protein BroJett020_22300 [Bacteroidota bacterium]
MTSTTEKPDELDVLLDSYLGELMEMSEEEVLDGDDPATIKALGLQLLDAAKVEAGRQRLLVAKEKLASRKAVSDTKPAPSISAQEAKAYIRRASNDPRFTLAARGLDEMSDEDALRLYEQLHRLERANDETPGVNEP